MSSSDPHPGRVPSDFVPLRERNGIHHQTCPQSCWCDAGREATPEEPRPCPYCGLSDHTGRQHFQFVMSLSLGENPDDDDE